MSPNLLIFQHKHGSFLFKAKGAFSQQKEQPRSAHDNGIIPVFPLLLCRSNNYYYIIVPINKPSWYSAVLRVMQFRDELPLKTHESGIKMC